MKPCHKYPAETWILHEEESGPGDEDMSTQTGGG